MKYWPEPDFTKHGLPTLSELRARNKFWYAYYAWLAKKS